MKKLPLHVKILLGMALGLVYGLCAVYFGWDKFTINFIKPFGTIFLNLLKLIAVPLVFISLVVGVSSLSDITKVRRIGLRTIIIYLCTTVFAVTLGLGVVNIIKPGNSFPESKREELKLRFSKNVESKEDDAAKVKKTGPLQFFVDLFPTNIFKSLTDNGQMLPIITFAILFGISMILIPGDKSKPIRTVFESANEVILKMIDIIMEYSPYGVFALIGSLLVEFAGGDINQALDFFKALGLYSFTVIIGLFMMIYIVYGSILKFIAKKDPFPFFKSIIPVQLLAFSTSSSSATLPVTMEHCEKELNLSPDVVSFVLPVGATVNMDGTSLYQSVAAVFIAQALGMELTLADQLSIVLTATLASVGSAGVPGAGMVMLVIVLNSIGVPTEGIALIFAVDRILDMLRTVVNVSGDMVVSTTINEFEEKRKINK
ncbi:MAG: dicarboxylate/amino acid:cation symporter [Leptospiraceae bacterium]|nr:dicarboxylate/amino acid:cation symporter [Leptospiraceae bacterium]